MMKTGPTTAQRRHDKGQTLVIALIILGILLILGFAFLGFINQNIGNANLNRKRSVSEDLAEAGVNYAHHEMLVSALGADWRGGPTQPAPDSSGANFTRDPDALYLRPGTGLAYRSDDPTQVDLGGPDGLGFFTRVNFQNGRALIRVRYAPSDANIFSSSPTGALRTPGRARNYIIIESVGRPGAVNPNDPTTAAAGPLVQFQGFGNSAQLQAALATMLDSEKAEVTSPKVVAFASIGMLESGLYITNKDRTSRPAEIGIPSELGANYLGVPVAVPMVFGGDMKVFGFGTPPTSMINPVGQGGSIYSNADVLIHGDVKSFLNATLGDLIAVDGTVMPADDVAKLDIFRNEYLPTRPSFPANWYGSWPATQAPDTVLTLTGSTLDSRLNLFTVGGVFRDGLDSVDANGFTRAASYKDPPLIDYTDSASPEDRYLLLTRDSGNLNNGVNSGQMGFGEGVYIDNDSDLQMPKTETGRAIAGSSSSLEYDWLNPDNGVNSKSGWRGPYYTPIGAYVSLRPDRIVITRDATDPNKAYWRLPDGTLPATPSATNVFRFGLGTDNRVHVVNELTPGIGDINASKIDYDLGPVFNGVLDFSGNVRIRGVIPTDVQLTVVSGGTIYIEGSITKGVVGNDVATDRPAGQLLARPTRSSLMLMAMQYVTLNTTQFFGSASSQYATDSSGGTANGITPVILKNQGDSLTLSHEFLLDPNPVNPTSPATDPNNPSSWQPYDLNYANLGGGVRITPLLMLSQAMDPSSGSSSYLNLTVNAGLATPSYLFPLDVNNAATSILGPTYVEPGYTNPGFAGVYGLGVQAWQRYQHFETRGFPIGGPNFTWNAGADTLTGTAANVSGTFSLVGQETNDLTLALGSLGTSPSAPYYLAKAAVVPADIRIEASMYAESGSFFVIPGPWFNSDPNDSRSAFVAKVQEYEAQGYSQTDATSLANQYRMDNYGSFPEAPFYGEPIDAKISIFGSVSENMPPPISVQAEWEKKWGWIPIELGSSSQSIPAGHQIGATNGLYAPNLFITYDPVLATGRVKGFVPTNDPTLNDPYVRTDDFGRPLPPMPRLPVSPTLAYFGDEKF